MQECCHNAYMITFCTISEKKMATDSAAFKTKRNYNEKMHSYGEQNPTWTYNCKSQRQKTRTSAIKAICNCCVLVSLAGPMSKIPQNRHLLLVQIKRIIAIAGFVIVLCSCKVKV